MEENRQFPAGNADEQDTVTSITDYVTEEPSEDSENVPSGDCTGSDAAADKSEDTPVESVETFIPTEYFTDEAEEPAPAPKPKSHIGRYVAIAAGVLLVAVVCFLVGYYLRLKNNPSSYFKPAATAVVSAAPIATVIPEAASDSTPAPDSTPDSVSPAAEPEQTPEADEYESLVAKADTSMMQNIVNIALIGVDYADERQTGYGGKAEDNAFHADVIIILAINFDENKVDMISIPRDTYAKIPGVKGIYKINASLDCGGGLFAPNGAGFEKVCETAEWMLGGIPVDYYYAVTMPAVKELGDAIGGVDFDVDIDFKIQGRSYKKGMQHLDGQGILDYFRVRKNIKQSGDNNRVNRQKRLLLAIFDKLKKENMLIKVPDILAAFNGMMYTNTTTSQTAALALFGLNLDSANVTMRSMGSGSNGTGGVTNIFNWNFCLTDQANRVKIIKDVYGIDVPQYREYTSTYAHYRWYSMLSDVYLDTAEELAAYVKKQIAADDLLPTPEPDETPEPDDPTPVPATPTPEQDNPTPAPATPTPEPEKPTPEPEKPTPAPEESSSGSTEANAAFLQGTDSTVVSLFSRGSVLSASSNTRKYTDEDRQAYNDFLAAIKTMKNAMEASDKQASKYLNGSSNNLNTKNGELSDAMESVKSKAIALAKTFGYNSSNLQWTYRYEYKRSFNEIQVNFN